MVNAQQLFQSLLQAKTAERRQRPAAPEQPKRSLPTRSLPPPSPAALPPHLVAAGFIQTPPLPHWEAAWRKGPQMVLPPRPCSCGGHLFWTPCPTGGPYICMRCHAPPFPERAARQVELVVLEGLPHIKVLARQASTSLK